MILLDGEVNGKPAALLLDTGAQFTLVSAKAANLVTVALFTLSVNGSVAIPATSLAPTLAAGNGGAVNTMLWYYPQVINAKASTVVQYSTTFTNGTGCSGFQYYVQPSLLQIQ